MLILVFALFVFVATVFENIFLLTSVFVGVLFFFFFLPYISKKYIKQRGVNMLWTIVIFCGVVALVVLKNYNYIPLNDSAFITQNTKKYFIGTGVITSLYKDQKVVFQSKILKNNTEKTQEIFLKTSQKYQVGDRVFLTAKINTAYDNAHIFDIKNQRKSFISGTLFQQMMQAYEFNYAKRLFMKSMQADAGEISAVKLGQKSLNFLDIMSSGLRKQIQNLYGDNRNTGLLLGMIVGDRYQIPNQEYESFKNAGLVHIVAVSGGNIIFVVIFLGFLFSQLPFYLRKFVIAGAIVVYAFLCGLDSSVIRAAIMGLLGIVALFAGREISVYRAMKYAFVLMLVYNPYFLVYDVGFLLSFSAIIGIIMMEKIQKSVAPPPSISSNEKNKKSAIFFQKGVKMFKELLYPTLGATMGVLPLLFFFMGEYNIMGIVANIFVLPIVGVVMISGIVSAVFYLIFPWSGFGFLTNLLMDYIYYIADKTVKRGIYIDLPSLPLKYFVLISWVIFVIWFLLIGYKQKERKD